jgi:hypothetical protein
MAAFHGKQGRVTFAGTATSNVLSWSIDASCSVVESSAMSAVAVAATTHWKDYVAGYLDWTATVECDLDDTGLDPDLDVDFIDDDGVAIVLYEGLAAQSVRMYYGTGIITGISPSLDKDDIAKVTYTIQGNGELSVAASDYAP